MRSGKDLEWPEVKIETLRRRHPRPTQRRSGAQSGVSLRRANQELCRCGELRSAGRVKPLQAPEVAATADLESDCGEPGVTASSASCQFGLER